MATEKVESPKIKKDDSTEKMITGLSLNYFQGLAFKFIVLANEVADNKKQMLQAALYHCSCGQKYKPVNFYKMDFKAFESFSSEKKLPVDYKDALSAICSQEWSRALTVIIKLIADATEKAASDKKPTAKIS